MVRAYRLAVTGIVFAGAVMAAATSTPATADWRTDLKVLRVGFVVGDNAPYRRNQLEPFRKYLQGKLGLPVEMVPAVSMAALIDQQVRSDIQYAVETGSAFVTAEALCRCVEPLVSPVSSDGSRGVLSVMVVNAASPITSLEGARGTKVAVVRGNSVAGRLVPLKAIAAVGFDMQKDITIVEFDSEDAALRALRAGSVDAALGWTTLVGDPNRGFSRGTLTRMVAANLAQMADIRIVWQTPLIPNGPHVVAKDLPDEAKQALRDALTGMAAADPLALDSVDRTNGGGFIAASAGSYDALRAIVTP